VLHLWSKAMTDQRPEREAIEQALTDQLIIDAIAQAEPEYRGVGMWLALPKDLENARRVLTDALLAALPPTPTPGCKCGGNRLPNVAHTPDGCYFVPPAPTGERE
jgi:hypothetical protein